MNQNFQIVTEHLRSNFAKTLQGERDNLVR